MNLESPGDLWFPLALLAALSFAGHNGIGKKALRSCTPLQLAFWCHVLLLAAMGGLLGIYRLVSGGPVLVTREGFWPAIFATSLLNVAALLLMFAGIRRSPLSSSVPYLSFTPAFILLTGWLLIGERAGWGGLLSVAAVALGSWMLQADTNVTLTAPLLRVFSDAGSRNLLAVALIFSVTAVVDKMALVRSDLLTFLFITAAIRTLLLMPAHLAAGRRTSGGGAAIRYSLPMGILFATEGLSQMSAIALGPVAYVIAVKRTSVLFSALLGFYAFGERRDPRIVLGILFMVGGAVALSLLGN